MDLSKLPKMSESPPPPAVEYADKNTPRPLRGSDVAFDIALLTVFGAILMMLGQPFGRWLLAKLRGQPYETGYVWPMDDQPTAGRPVEFFDLQGAGAWPYVGEWVSGVALLAAALVLVVAIVTKRGRGAALILAAGLCAAGALANGVAAGVQLAAGIQPIISLLLLVLCGVSGYSLMRHKAGGALT